MDSRALEEPQPLDICLLDDINVLAGWEYWLKLSYYTADLHIVRAWSLNSRATEVSFESQARVRISRGRPSCLILCLGGLYPHAPCCPTDRALLTHADIKVNIVPLTVCILLPDCALSVDRCCCVLQSLRSLSLPDPVNEGLSPLTSIFQNACKPMCASEWLPPSNSTSSTRAFGARSCTTSSSVLSGSFSVPLCVLQALQGAIVYSFLDADRLQNPQSLDEALKGRRFACDWEQQVFPVGALEAPVSFAASPTGTFKVLLCKLATGSTLAHQEADGDFATREIPGAYASMALIQSSPATSETKMLRMQYRVRKSTQVLPSLVLEFAFQSLLIEVSQPMCEVCTFLPATLFCPADRAHLCDECDQLHHSASRLLARHKRLPVTHSPFQFGQCPNHPSEMIDCVCMVVRSSAFQPQEDPSLCIVLRGIVSSLHSHRTSLSGRRIQDEHARHFPGMPLLSLRTTLALHAAVDSSVGPPPCSPLPPPKKPTLPLRHFMSRQRWQEPRKSEEALSLRREKILKDLQDNHRLLARLHANFVSVHRKIDDSNKCVLGSQLSCRLKARGAMGILELLSPPLSGGERIFQQRLQGLTQEALMEQLQILKNRQVGFLQAIKRELLTECLIIEWMEAFFAHLRLALCPSDYLNYQHRHDLLVRALPSVCPLLPRVWNQFHTFEGSRFRVFEGLTGVSSTPFSIPELRASKVADDNLVSVLCKYTALHLREQESREKGEERGKIRGKWWGPDSRLRVFLTGIDKTRKTKLKILETESTEESGVAACPASDDDSSSADDDEGDTAVAEWSLLVGTADDAIPGPQVHALSKVLLFPDEPAAQGLPSQKQQEVIEAEGTNCERAETDKDTLPPQVRKALEAAERREREDLASGNGLVDPLNSIPRELPKQLWAIASDINFKPLLLILKAAGRQQLPDLLRNSCRLACYMRDIQSFLKKLLEFELEAVSHLPESMFLSAASLVSPLLDSMLLPPHPLLLMEDRRWLFSMLGAPLGALTRALAAQGEAHSGQNGAPDDVVFPPLKELVDRVTETRFCVIPATLRGLLYLLTDCIDAQGPLWGGLTRVHGGPPIPFNTVSAAAVCVCSQVLLCHFFATSLQLMREEALAGLTAKENVKQQLALAVPPQEAGKEVAEVAAIHSERYFWERRNLPSLSILGEALRRLGTFCWDPAVTAMLLDQDKLSLTKEEKAMGEALAKVKERLETHPDHRFFAELAVRLVSWMRGQLALPRLFSPLTFSALGQPRDGQNAAKAILTHIAKLDEELKNGEATLNARLTPEDIYSPHFDQLVSLALKAAAFTLPKTSA
ncbi:b-box zinc finger domain-containing protein [Cyclospora cayetanensis]|uniref:B-box zinc finger domain-containing protein n=1 Tax=Cyclospora cayetanensis TaxID=88456 RepID=A0A1D3CXW2_9EIME|nr:b-box zinc finger domain-containing protein [Cyclospora cayetanensis]